ncbi:MAG: TlyA family RNA methyltransferase [Candidatus Melainabacteria bacterium]|nr:TlyA family RNA methyltransferase [Candidatus Melainabacteria bacterium]
MQEAAKNKKVRLDALLLSRGLAESKTQAQGLILAGLVQVKGQRVDKPGQQVPSTTELSVSQPEHPYVSRGGMKLAFALEQFQVSPLGRVCLDVGASTGGFTDCLLQQGAQSVLALDVGYGQLHWRLRQHPQVLSLERTHIRDLIWPEDKLARPTLAVIDVSFISLKKVLPGVMKHLEGNLSAEEAPPQVIALLKPQFEYLDYIPPAAAQRFRGVVQHAQQHEQIIGGLLGDLATLCGHWQVTQLIGSPIHGSKGNREFLIHLQPKTASKPIVSEAEIRRVVYETPDAGTT